MLSMNKHSNVTSPLNVLVPFQKRFSGLEKDEEFSFAICDTVFDVATALKQYLREMDAPVIPYDLHGLFRM